MPRPGSSRVSSAAASDVKMEGSNVQQKPPEDHADHELKRQKDSDSAGQYSSAIDELSWKRSKSMIDYFCNYSSQESNGLMSGVKKSDVSAQSRALFSEL